MVEERPAEALIVFTPSGKRGRFPIGTPVLTAARQLGVDIDSVCGGRGICGRCKVLLSEGEFDALSPLVETEEMEILDLSMPDSPDLSVLGNEIL